MRIDFEHMAPFLLNADTDDSDEDEDLFDNDLAAQVQADIVEAVLQMHEGSGSEDEELFDLENEVGGPADIQEAVQLLQMEGDLSDGQFEEDLDDGEGMGEFPNAPAINDETDHSDVEVEPNMQGGLGNTSSDPDTEAHHKVPSIARWRLNLTALSQKYNLYFVAYRETIHVSRPRSCVYHNLPSVPDMVLRPGSSAAAQSVGGTLDPTFPHQANHLIIGRFGDQEILLIAYDDGDVIAYYTRAIEEDIIRYESCSDGKASSATTKPFFQENVQISAWGLAIHSQSRLIAVGSNLHTVTVFAPALTGHPYQSNKHVWNTVHKNAIGMSIAGNLRLQQSNATNESWMRRRDANWMITLGTTPQGDNIPNIAFSSDETGTADNVVAIDVKGNIWLMPIWAFGTPSRKIPAIHRGSPNTLPGHIGRPRGWGVLVAESSSFLPVEGIKDALGVEDEKELRFASHAVVGRWLDTSKGIRHIPHNSTQHPWAGSRQRERHALHAFDRIIDNEWWFAEYPVVDPRQSGLVTQNQSGRVRRDHLSMSRDAILSDRGVGQRPNPVLANGASILRLYETDIELRSHEADGVGIIMQHATKQIQPRPAGLPALRWAHERLSNNHYIPELSLVVAGSMCGRVALITLTKPEDNSLFERGFKIEAILPTREDEDGHLRPICPLFGVAIGPLPVDGRQDPGSLLRGYRRRYRIMLQYYDQRILSYEIRRGKGSDALLIT